jgi:hypothetical protein
VESIPVDTIGLEERVTSLYDSTVSGFMGRLEISSVSVLNSVGVLVLGVSLKLHTMTKVEDKFRKPSP